MPAAFEPLFEALGQVGACPKTIRKIPPTDDGPDLMDPRNCRACLVSGWFGLVRFVASPTLVRKRSRVRIPSWAFLFNRAGSATKEA
jgi:hypothetical protein